MTKLRKLKDKIQDVINPVVDTREDIVSFLWNNRGSIWEKRTYLGDYYMLAVGPSYYTLINLNTHIIYGEYNESCLNDLLDVLLDCDRYVCSRDEYDIMIEGQNISVRAVS